MLNPDGVIVGNYRCSLAGRDLNRNYRHPKKESFPTVWNTKQMLADFSEDCEVGLVIFLGKFGFIWYTKFIIDVEHPPPQKRQRFAFSFRNVFP